MLKKNILMLLLIPNKYNFKARRIITIQYFKNAFGYPTTGFTSWSCKRTAMSIEEEEEKEEEMYVTKSWQTYWTNCCSNDRHSCQDWGANVLTKTTSPHCIFFFFYEWNSLCQRFLTWGTRTSKGMWEISRGTPDCHQFKTYSKIFNENAIQSH